MQPCSCWAMLGAMMAQQDSQHRHVGDAMAQHNGVMQMAPQNWCQWYDDDDRRLQRHIVQGLDDDDEPRKAIELGNRQNIASRHQDASAQHTRRPAA